jgi:hypothetical protein
MSPTARTLTLNRKSGYLCRVVETWVPRVNRRRDLFGFADVLAVHPVRREVVLIQTTTADHLAHRLAKVKAVPELPGLLAVCKVQVHGWRKVRERWRVKVVEVLAEDLVDVLVTAPARRRKRDRQPMLLE